MSSPERSPKRPPERLPERLLQRLIVGISGASGVIYGFRLSEALSAVPGGGDPKAD